MNGNFGLDDWAGRATKVEHKIKQALSEGFEQVNRLGLYVVDNCLG